LASSAAECVCHSEKAQGYSLREGHRRDATERLRIGRMALSYHYGVNLLTYPERQGAAPKCPDGHGLRNGE